MALTSLTAKQMELAKLRIVKILRKYDKDSYIKDMTTYGAIAAINSKMGASLIPAAANSADTNIYSATTLDKPLNDLMSLRDSDPGLFKIATSKAMMLAHTNAGAPAAFDSTTNAYDPYSVKETINGVTAYTKSLQAYVNYQAALVLTGVTLSTAAAAPYSSLKCMIGEGILTSCSLGKWGVDQANSLLTLNVLSENYGGSTSFMPTLDGTDFDATTGIPKLVVKATGDWYTFDTAYANIAEAVGNPTKNGSGRDKFFKIYNSLEHKRAVTADEFKVYHESIETINGLTKLKSVLNDQKILSLVDEGIMTFADASRDATTSTDAAQPVAVFDKLGHLGQKHIWSWVEKLPVGTAAADTAMTRTSWDKYHDEFWFFAAARDATFASLLSGSQGIKKANSVTFAELTNVAAVSSYSVGGSASGYSFGYGIYGNRKTGCDGYNCPSATDTYQNFYNKVIKNNNAVAILKSGVKLPSLCADLDSSSDAQKCAVDYQGLGIAPTTTYTYAKEYGSYWDCIFSKEGAELFSSAAANYWESPTALIFDIKTHVCV